MKSGLQLSRPYVNFYAALLMVFSMPFIRWLSTYFIALWILTWIIEGNFKSRFLENKKALPLLVLPAAFYLIHLAGLMLSENMASSRFDLQVKMSFIIFPFIFIMSNKLYKENYLLILKTFIVSVVLASVLCLIHALFISVTYDNGQWTFNADVINDGHSTWELIKLGGSNFMYTRLSDFMHPGYFSYYIVFAIALLLFVFLEKTHHLKTRTLIILLIAYLILFNFLLFSRIGLVNISLVFLSYFIFKAITGKVKTYRFMHFVIIIFTLTFIIVAFTTNNRIKKALSEIKNFDIEKISVSNPESDRLPIWYVSSRIIKDNWLWGVGNGDVKDELKSWYQKLKLNDAYSNSLNAHNQFLETFAGTGILGFIALLLIFFISFYKSLVSQNTILTIFIVISAIFCSIESIFNRQNGTVFFVFFLCLFMVNLKKTELS